MVKESSLLADAQMVGSHENRVRPGLAVLGLRAAVRIYGNDNATRPFEESVRRGEEVVSEHGALVVRTGEHTGRAAKDKYVVRAATTQDTVAWGEVNQPLAPEKFRALWQRVLAH